MARSNVTAAERALGGVTAAPVAVNCFDSPAKIVFGWSIFTKSRHLGESDQIGSRGLFRQECDTVP